MAHEINASDVFGEVRARGQRAWHGLGVELDTGLGAWDAFQKIGLGWGTELLPVYSTLPDGQQIEIDTHRAHVRSDNHQLLGIVGEGYRPIANRTLAEFADALVGTDNKVETETAGSLRSGRVVFSLVRLPKDIEVVDGDILNQYVLIRNSHDGSAAFSCYPTSIRVVCANTLRFSERDSARGIRFQHSGDIGSKIEQARLVLGLITKESDRFEAMVRILAAKHLTKDQVREYFKAVYDSSFGIVPTDDEKLMEKRIARREELLSHWEGKLDEPNQRVGGIAGTAWAAYNAVSEWHDHERGRFGKVDQSDGRAHSNLFGVADAHKRLAFDAAMALV